MFYCSISTSTSSWTCHESLSIISGASTFRLSRNRAVANYKSIYSQYNRPSNGTTSIDDPSVWYQKRAVFRTYFTTYGRFSDEHISPRLLLPPRRPSVADSTVIWKVTKDAKDRFFQLTTADSWTLPPELRLTLTSDLVSIYAQYLMEVGCSGSLKPSRVK
jgi:hypothetical protein